VAVTADDRLDICRILTQPAQVAGAAVGRTDRPGPETFPAGQRTA